MAPSKAAAAVAPFSKDERVLCFHHDMLYEAKVLDTRPTEDKESWQYKIHYKGWKATWDDWVPQDRVRKFTEENKELAAQLHHQMKALQQKGPKTGFRTGGKGNKANGGSDFSSARGSEERHTSVAAPGRGGPRRGRDYELEHLLDEDAGSASPSLRRRLRSSSDSPEQEPLQANFSTRRSRRETVDVAAWSDPSSPDWDVIRVLQSDACLAEDYLTKKPPSDHAYLASLGAFKDRSKYEKMKKQKPASGPAPAIHPKLQEHINNGTDTAIIHHYYSGIPADRCLPTAGIIFEEPRPVEVVAKRSSLRTVVNGKASPSTVHGIATASLPENIPPGPRNGKATHKIFSGRASQIMNNVENPNLTQHLQEETFHQRPSIKLIIPDHIKALLVDDWENVTKNQQLVPLPSAHPVNSILDDYYNYEMPRRIAGSAQADILEEVIAGLKDYFEKCLGRILLYRFERNQYTEVREAWMSNRGDMSGKGAGDTYGAEHLCRLLVSLPELIAQTNMDSQSVNRLREELSKMANWLGRNADHYFVKEYETPSQQYVEKARGV